MIGKKGRGAAEIINIPPMNLKEYGELPYYDLKLLKFRIEGLEELRAGSFLQYNLYLNPNVVAAFVDYNTKECFVVINDKESKESIAKFIQDLPSYSGKKVNYSAVLESEEEVDYPDILKHRFSLEFVD